MTPITYKILGEFFQDMAWEDFIPETNGRPRVTIQVEGVDDAQDIPAGQDFFAKKNEEDNWYDATVRGELTEETAKAVLAHINNVSPDEIVIVQKGLSPAVSL